MTKDPKPRNEFASFDDAPTNKTGKGQEETDWDEIRPPSKVVPMFDDDEIIDWENDNIDEY